MQFNEEDIKEFELEAQELLDQAETSLLALDQGADFKSHYDAIFRAFHSIKGAAGMMELTELQGHLHQLESILTQRKGEQTLAQNYIDLFLRGTDAARLMLKGKPVSFVYETTATAPSSPIAQATAPVAAAALAPSASLPRPEPALPAVTAPPARGKVLVIDDETEIVEILSMMLEEAGFEVHGLSQPEKVMELLPKFAPDIILTDIAMPNLTGAELLAQIRQAYSDVPVAFVSGFASRETLVKSIPDGIFAVIDKPFSRERVIEVCQQAINRPRPLRLLSESIELLLFKYADLDDYLCSTGDELARSALQRDMTQLLERCRDLKAQLVKKAA